MLPWLDFMSGRANQLDQMDAITKVIEFSPYSEAIKNHVRQVIESPAFKGSRRSQQFLLFVVETALAGHFDNLKERTLGSRLFGREPAYNTADDAIVRVTACDVRKRLIHFYSDFGAKAEFRIELPPGSYIPEFQKNSAGLTGVAPDYPDEGSADVCSAPLSSAHAGPTENSPARTAPPSLEQRAAKGFGVSRFHRFAPWFVAAICSTVALGLWARGGSRLGSGDHRLPWSAVIQTGHHTRLIFCDPEIVSIQKLSKRTLSLSDYANQHYWAGQKEIRPDLRWAVDSGTFRGVNISSVDVGILLHILSMENGNVAQYLEPHTARSIRLADFKTDDNFILFGSPRSNPWVELFQDQLDFVFAFDEGKKAEFIRNKHPRAGEQPQYVPTANGWDTGQAYAVIAATANPNQSGQVLILAGSDAEGTEAAGKLATDVKLLSRVLQEHGINPGGPPRHFEILLQVSTMAGSSNTFQVLAVHILTDKARQN
jgi:hypothetical protein